MINKIFDIHNEYIEFICKICSIPLSDIKWIKNDKILSNKIKKIFIENDECLTTILIVNVS
jgi:hypothetical protein